MPIKTPEHTGWIDYTPVWTAVTTNPVLGNGTMFGRYTRTGRTVTAQIKLVMGSTTTFGAGAWRFSLPTKAIAIDRGVGQAFANDVGTNFRHAAVLLQVLDSGGVSLVSCFREAASAAYAAAEPFTWTTSDELWIQITYDSDQEG